MQTLEIIIGLVFIFLLLSLLATIIQELLSSLISLRGRVLLDALIKILEIDDKKLKKKFRKKIKNSSVYRKYVSKLMGTNHLPSYLTSSQVVAILQDVLGNDGDGVSERGITTRSLDDSSGTKTDTAQVDTYALKDKSINQSLVTLQQGSSGFSTRSLDSTESPINDEFEKAKAAVSKNFNEMMDRASGWYKRRIQVVLLAIGMTIAIAFDADTFKIYGNLTDDPEARQEVLALAQSAVKNNVIVKYETPKDSIDQVQRAQELKTLLDSLLLDEIQTVKSPLGLGREAFPAPIPESVDNAFLWRLKKFFGWIVTALAISLGAPFWFDILKLLINIRNSGVVPKEQTTASK